MDLRADNGLHIRLLPRTRPHKIESVDRIAFADASGDELADVPAYDGASGDALEGAYTPAFWGAVVEEFERGPEEGEAVARGARILG